MTKALSLVLIPVLLLSLTGCNSTINAQTFKAYFKLAADTFIAAESASNPGWNSAKLATDVNGLIAVWNVGTNWQTNAINELVAIQGDVGDIPNCTVECQALTIVFLGAAATGIAIAQANHPQTMTASASVLCDGGCMNKDSAKKVGKPLKVYKTTAEYKADWDAVAPEGHKL